MSIKLIRHLSIHIKLLSVVGMTLFASLQLFGQQEFHLTQFIYSSHAVNPAFSGVEDQVNVHAGFRRQWTSIDNAPLSHYAGIKGSLSGFKNTFSDKRSLRLSVPRLYNRMQFEPGNVAHGLGAYFSTDREGPFNSFHTYLSYAYIYTISRNFKVSVGVAGYFQSQKFNEDRVSVFNPDQDQVYQDYLSGDGNKMDLGLNMGVLIYGRSLFLGYSIHELASVNMNSNNVNQVKEGFYHYILGGYNFTINQQLTLQPSFLFKYNKLYDFSVDVIGKLKYRELMWLGLGYRDQDAISFLFGFMIEEKIHFGYSFDYHTDAIGEYARGSHEIVLAFRIYNDKVSKPFLW